MIDDSLLLEYYAYVDSLGLCGATTRDVKSLARRYAAFISKKKLKPGPDSVRLYVEHRDCHLTSRKRETTPGFREQRNSNSVFQLTRFLKFLVSKKIIPPTGYVLGEKFQAILDDYKRHLEKENIHSNATYIDRIRNARRFLVYAERRGIRGAEGIRAGLVYDYFRANYKHGSRKTAENIFADFRDFFHYLHRKGLIERDFTHSLITPRAYKHARLPKVIDEK